jgi:inner membrane protein
MDNLTHSLVGLVAAKAGLEKLSPRATTVCVLAANAPDLDVVSGVFGDRWSVLHYHRALTHSIAGTVVLALVLPLVFYLADLLLARVRRRPRRMRLRGLVLASLIVSATHPLMDWTNNYGIRLLLPWSSKWFYGDLVFIVDPWLWLVFGAAAFLLTAKSLWQVAFWSILAAVLTAVVVFAGVTRGALAHPGVILVLWTIALIALVILNRVRLDQLVGRKIAMAAFAFLFVYWGGLAFLHARALNKAGTAMMSVANRGEKVTRLAAMPTLANPAQWQCVAETDRAVYRFEVFLIFSGDDVAQVMRIEKPDPLAARAIIQASRDPHARIFLEFARFPVARVVASDCASQTLVQFADLRYTEPGRPRGNFSLEVPVDCPSNAPGTTDGR